MTQRKIGNLAAISIATLAIVGTPLEALLYLNSDASLNVGLAIPPLVFTSVGALGLIIGIGLLVEDTNYAVVNYGLPLIAILGSAAMPISIGIAILRHNLYDIDLIINKTLVYSLLTGSLALVYLGGVLLLQLLLQPLAPDSDLAIAASTLAVAALFQPLRRRIQDAVDRRLYRRKYDAAQTLEQFAGQLREQVDLSTLRTELESIVQETMQPASVSLWLRAGEQPRRRPAS